MYAQKCVLVFNLLLFGYWPFRYFRWFWIWCLFINIKEFIMRRRMSRRKSRKLFRKGTRTHKKNLRAVPMRGGFRI